MEYRTIKELGPLAGRRVLVRVDYNVPVDPQSGQVTDETRITSSVPTLQYLLEQNAAVVIISHLGRPQGERDRQYSLKPAADRLAACLPYPVRFVDDIVGEKARAAVAALHPREVLILQNLRYDERETANDADFSRALAQFGDVYVDDAWGCAHRAHASIAGIPQYLPSAVGFFMEEELTALQTLRHHPKRPFWAIIGGAKVSDKVKLLTRLLDDVDGLVIGGGMANTFLVAEGFCLGASKVEATAVDHARQLLKKAQDLGRQIVLPVDVVVAEAFSAAAPHRVSAVNAVGAEEMALDIGPKTIERIEQSLAPAATVFWNGPMGVFEWDAFAHGTMAIAHFLAKLPAHVVVGGGDSVAAVNAAGVAGQLAHVSTGGGATLEYLEGVDLPGVAVLAKAREGM